jgi:hypothetical protein
VVECDLAKVEVAGSNPVSRSQKTDEGGGNVRMKQVISSFIPPPSALIPIPFRRRSQVVRQRSAKPLFVGSIPTAASI